MSKLEWTDTIPTEEGWYWMRSDVMFINCPIEVFKRPGHDFLCILNPNRHPDMKRDFMPIAGLGAKWSTKIESPE